MATALKKIPTRGGPRARAGLKNPRAKIVVPGNHGVKVVRAITIHQPAGELYAFWRNLANLAQIIHHRVAITAKSDEESHWSVSAPGKHQLEWDALIINDKPGRMIAWRTREGSAIASAGSVRFEAAADDAGTKVTVALEYDPPGGAIATFTREAASAQVYDALRRFKERMEAGGAKG